MNEKIKKPGLFIAITFAICWLMIIIFTSLGGKWNTSSATILALVYMFIPMISAILVQKYIYKEPLKDPLGISFKLNRWWLVAWFIPPVIAFATIGISLLIPGISYSPEMTGFFQGLEGVIPKEQLEQMKIQMDAFRIHPIWIALIQGLFAGITINAVAGFGEELGWRGFLQKEFNYMGFWKSSALIGLIWGIWHAPIILQGHNYPEHPLEGVFMMIIFCLLLSPIFSYVRLKSKSVIPAAIIHGSLNATVGLAIMVVWGGNDLIVGVTGLSGFIVLIILNLFLFFFDRFISKKPVSNLI